MRGICAGNDRPHARARPRGLSAGARARPRSGDVSQVVALGPVRFQHPHQPHPICYSVAFDPDGWKRVSDDMVREAGVELRLHSWFSHALVRDGRMEGVVVESKSGRQAILGTVVIDATGDLDVAAGGRRAVHPRRLHGHHRVPTRRRRHRRGRTLPVRGAGTVRRDRSRGKRIIGGSWDYWWLKTPLPGIVWCNCPHMTGLDGLKVEDLTARRIRGTAPHPRAWSIMCAPSCRASPTATSWTSRRRPACGRPACWKANTSSPRRTCTPRVRFPDSIARGRDYYTPYRAMLPREVDQLLVAGRHYSATPQAQKISPRNPALHGHGRGRRHRRRDGACRPAPRCATWTWRHCSGRLRAQGADPGDQPPTVVATEKIA